MGSIPIPKQQTVHLDGRTLEGGGQLVRNAVALSAITGQAVTIEHIRGNREGGKKGLKGSHLAAINLLAEVSAAEVSGAEIGSSSLYFAPPAPGASQRPIQAEYTVRLPTAGSVFLVFQALYPYLLYAGADSQDRPIRLQLTGGTNVSFSPSYDYVSQVLIPNLARLGFPSLSIELQRRGWATGPVDLGAVTLLVHPLAAPPDGGNDTPKPQFPRIDMSQYHRGEITHIEITILAPDTPIPGTPHSGNGPADSANDPQETIRNCIQTSTLSLLERQLERLPKNLFNLPSTSKSELFDSTLPAATIQASEKISHRSHIYVLLVAHTTTGFKLGRDALFGTEKGETLHSKPRKDKHKRNYGSDKSEPGISTAKLNAFVERCVDGFVEEVYNPSLQRPSALDVFMRDQVVVFEALGRLDRDWDRKVDAKTKDEDESPWSLHTQTARSVCEEMLGMEW